MYPAHKTFAGIAVLSQAITHYVSFLAFEVQSDLLGQAWNRSYNRAEIHILSFMCGEGLKVLSRLSCLKNLGSSHLAVFEKVYLLIIRHTALKVSTYIRPLAKAWPILIALSAIVWRSCPPPTSYISIFLLRNNGVTVFVSDMHTLYLSSFQVFNLFSNIAEAKVQFFCHCIPFYSISFHFIPFHAILLHFYP